MMSPLAGAASPGSFLVGVLVVVPLPARAFGDFGRLGGWVGWAMSPGAAAGTGVGGTGSGVFSTTGAFSTGGAGTDALSTTGAAAGVAGDEGDVVDPFSVRNAA